MKDFTIVLRQMWKRCSPKIPMVIITAVLVAMALLTAASRFSKDITVIVDGKAANISTYRAKVGDALKGADIEIGHKDKISPSIEDGVKDKMTITIKRAVPVKVSVDGKELAIISAEDTVSEMLKAEGIVLNEKDKIVPELNSNIKKDLDIKIVRVEEKLITSTEKIAYRTFTQNDNNMEKGSTKVLQDGEDGEKEVTTKVTYEDGKEVSRDEVAVTVKKPAVNKIVAVGTLSWFRSSRSGSKVYYTKSYRMKATSYYADYNSTGKNPGDPGFGITASGMRVKRDPDGYSTVAVDPDVIPLGTKLYIEGYGYAVAADTGGGVNGKMIDLYFERGAGERWSTHYVNVYVVK